MDLKTTDRERKHPREVFRSTSKVRKSDYWEGMVCRMKVRIDFLKWIWIFLSSLTFEQISTSQENERFTDFFERDYMLGDWLGSRPWLEEHGIGIELYYSGEFFRMIRGGINTHHAGEYNGLFSFDLEIDTRAAGWWDQGAFFIQLQEHHGDGLTERHAGDYQVLSNIDADDFKQLSELWYRHSWMDERLWIKFGKQDANTEFAFVEYGSEFLHSSPGYPPSIALATYPDSDWGLVVGGAPSDWISVNLGVFTGTPDGGRSIRSSLDNFNGPMVLIEPTFHYTIGDYPGHFRIGGWWNGARFEKIDADAPDPGFVDESYGLYATIDQLTWREGREDPTDPQGIGVFAQYAWAPPNRSEVHHYVGAGIQWTGAMAGRDMDVMGIGIFHVAFSGQSVFPDDSETAVELFYAYQLFGWMSLRPDLQWIRHPGGMGNKDALAIGLRWDIRF